MSNEPKKNPLAVVTSVILFMALLWYFFGGGIEDKVATDAVKEYEIAKRNGDKMDACVHAGIVAAAYLQAKDEANYKLWKRTERSDCAAAGIEQ